MAVKLRIENLNHASGVISSYEVLQPDFNYTLNDSGTCAWKIALSQTNTSGVSIQPDEFGPKATDYLLRGDDGTHQVNLQGGRLLDVGLDSDTGIIECAGKDWLEYLNQPLYFGTHAGDGYQASVFTLGDAPASRFVKVFVTAAGTDDAVLTYNATQQKVVQYILTQANLLSDIAYAATFSGTGWSEVLEYEIHFLDETTLLSHIQAISAYADPLGFDFYIDWDKRIYFHAPRTVLNPSSVTTILDLVYGMDAVVKVSWHNSGPKATRTVGKNSIGLWKERSFPASISAYRDELEIIDLGEKYDFGTTYAGIQHRVDVATDSIGTFDWNPQKDITLTVLPDKLFPLNEVLGFTNLVGQAISFDSGNLFAPYHRINAKYYIVSQTYRTDDDSGNYLMDFGLQQIYAT